mmetsp:Transcript_1573/g.4007  ORF Transcript_1573/g.4007 Transcript_1573/m.4007 type:complete len:218 (-) Transcript_1573:2057-2710(-)
MTGVWTSGIAEGRTRTLPSSSLSLASCSSGRCFRRTTTSWLESTSTRTNSPSVVGSPRNDSASLSSRRRMMARRSGRAPYTGLYPSSTQSDLKRSVSDSTMPRSSHRFIVFLNSSSAISPTSSFDRVLKTITSSSLFRNSGLKKPFSCSSTLDLSIPYWDWPVSPPSRESPVEKPISPPTIIFSISFAPQLDVRMISVFLNDTRRPLESVRRPSSRI